MFLSGVRRHGVVAGVSIGIVGVLAMTMTACGSSTTDSSPLKLEPTATSAPRLQPAPPSARLVESADTGKPGSVLLVEDPPRGEIREINQRDAVVKRIVYRSTSGVTGEPTEVSGILVVPNGKPPKGGWPLVAFGHGNSGIEVNCGPSEYGNLLGNDKLLEAFRVNGYAVVMSDYEGLGTGNGIHPFLNAKTYGNNQLDAVRAARAIAPDISNTWVSFGVSLGGMAAWAAADRQPEYAPETDLAATVALVPVGDMSGLAERAWSGTLTREQYPLLVYALESLSKVFPQRFNLDDYRSPYAKSVWGRLVECVAKTSAEFAENQRVLTTLGPTDLRPRSREAVAALRDQLQDWALPVGRNTSPTLVMYGTSDELIPPDWTEKVLKRACGEDQNLTIIKRIGETHGGLDSEQAVPWMRGVLNGDKPVSNCDRRP